MSKLQFMILGGMLSVVVGRACPCYGQAGPGPVSVEQMLLDSQVVAVGRLTGYLEDPDAKAEQEKALADAKVSTRGNFDVRPLAARRLRGTYTFGVQLRLKGQCPDVLTYHVPLVDWLTFGDSRFEVRDGTSYLLLLVRRNDAWTPAPRTPPVIPLGQGVRIPTATGTESLDLTNTVVRLMLSGLDDRPVRGATLRILSGTHGAEIVAAARRYWDDPEYYVKQAALCCLATNQVVEAIPRILKMKETASARGGDLGLGASMEVFQTPEAVRYLNEALFNADRFVRLQAMLTLWTNRLADKSSIPYLMVALSDPDPMVASTADQALHALIPQLGPWRGREYFTQSRDETIRAVEKWWTDELAGKHKDDPPIELRPRAVPPPVPPGATTRRGSSRGPAD
jgi:hypothetical protein